ncbi:MAG: citrate synthase [Myxococcales bacterium]|nr:citrate synthase [Myxococcales bacterium]USN51074.1 MAG: citrate synthase [Myxococcales bacterium]
MRTGSIEAKGLDGVVVGDTVLSKVDGEEGELVYRGYNIDELANCNFEQICHLFLYGELPNNEAEQKLRLNLQQRYKIPQDIIDFICRQAQHDHPMATLRTSVSMISSYVKEPSLKNENELIETSLNLIAKTGTIAAAICRARSGKTPVAPDASMSYSKNFLYMCTGKIPEDVVVKTMDTAMILHMDHGFNASTFTARAVTSTLSDMISAVTAAIGTLKGPLHGGANTAVMKMLMEIGTIDNIEAWLEKALAEKRKIMGFGHRVYKVADPRAKHLKRMSKEWGERAQEKKWFAMSEKLEALMLEKKGINANVDFYSASTYYTMGIEPDMYTPIFAVARMVGWTAHVMEQLKDNRLMRPEANYIGPIGKVLKEQMSLV